MKIKIYDILFTLLISGISFLYFFYYDLNVDTTWILYTAKQLLNGYTLYIDITDVNPPLVFILSVIAAYFSKLLNIDINITFIVFTFLIIIFSLFLTFKLIININPLNNYIRNIIYLIAFTLTIFIGYNFGEREHLFIIFVFPYIIYMTYINKFNISKHLKIIIIIFASIGFNLKPHFFILFFAIEFTYIAYKKNIRNILRLEILIILISVLVYLLIIYFYFYEYISITIPISIDTYIIAFNQSFYYLLSNYEILLLIAIFILFIFNKPIYNTYEFSIIFVSIISVLVIYFLQSKGWSYHRIPILMVIILFIIHITYFQLKITQLNILLLLPIIFVIIIKNWYANVSFNQLKSIIKNLPNNSNIQVVSTDIASCQPLLKKTQVWASRYSGLFMLSALKKKGNFKTREYLIETFLIDLNKFKPDYIIFPNYFNMYHEMVNLDGRIKEFYENNYLYSEENDYKILKRKNIEKE